MAVLSTKNLQPDEPKNIAVHPAWYENSLFKSKVASGL